MERRNDNKNKIGQAIREIYRVDELAARDQWVNELHPLVKFVLTIIYIAVVVSFDKYDFAGLLGMMIYPIAGFILAELSFTDSIYRLRVVLPLVCIVGLFNPFFDKTPVLFGGWVVRAGVISMLTLMLKGIFSVLASYLLIATTGVEKLCYAFALLHVPKILITQFMLTYRYVTLLLAEVERMTQAYSLRAPGQKGVHFKVWGSLTGQLLLRSMDRANAVYESMVLRGYDGGYAYMGRKVRLRMADCVYGIFWLGIFWLFRKYPVMILVGNWVGAIL